MGAARGWVEGKAELKAGLGAVWAQAVENLVLWAGLAVVWAEAVEYRLGLWAEAAKDLGMVNEEC